MNKSISLPQELQFRVFFHKTVTALLHLSEKYVAQHCILWIDIIRINLSSRKKHKGVFSFTESTNLSIWNL